VPSPCSSVSGPRKSRSLYGASSVLTVGGAVVVRAVDGPGDLHHHHPGLLEVVEFDAVYRPPRDHQVVVVVEAEAPELGVQRPRPAVDEEHVVGRAVDQEGALLPLRDQQADPDLAVDQQPLPAGDRVAVGRQPETLEEGVLVDLLVLHRGVVGVAFDDVLDSLRHVPVIEERGRTGVTPAAEELLVERRSLDLEAQVTLPGHLAESHVRPHRARLTGAVERGVAVGAPGDWPTGAPPDVGWSAMAAMPGRRRGRDRPGGSSTP